MRGFFTILSLTLTLSLFGHTNDPNNEKCKDKQNKPKEEKLGTLPAQLNYYEEDALKQEAISIDAPESALINPVEADSTSSSISKYNYLFYFIYKYKFENKLGVDQIERLITD